MLRQNMRKKLENFCEVEDHKKRIMLVHVLIGGSMTSCTMLGLLSAAYKK